MNRIELEKRLVGNSAEIIFLCKTINFDEFTSHLPKQIVRSSSSAALNYGEAQSAESRKDFAHKLGLVLKELRETEINLQIIEKTGICVEKEKLENLLKENRQLIAIFQKSVETAKSKLQ
jgi:four helix bundle protein